MTTVFADTFYYLALLSPRDNAHEQAVAATIQLQSKILTTAWVLTEVADALAAPVNRGLFIALLEKLKGNPDMQIISADEELFALGIALYGSRNDKGWSLTDCISFVVMQREGIREALTGDHHFEQAGFVALLK